MNELSNLLLSLGDHRGMIQVYEDQILRGRDPIQRTELARTVAKIWEEDLSDAREAADAWRGEGSGVFHAPSSEASPSSPKGKTVPPPAGPRIPMTVPPPLAAPPRPVTAETDDTVTGAASGRPLAPAPGVTDSASDDDVSTARPKALGAGVTEEVVASPEPAPTAEVVTAPEFPSPTTSESRPFASDDGEEVAEVNESELFEEETKNSAV
jgi:hypothetical protein